MDSIKEWAVMICSISVGSVFTIFLIPEGKLKKYAETVISLVFLLLVVSLVVNSDLPDIDEFELDLDIPIDLQEYDQLEFYGANAKEFTENFVADKLREICKNDFSVNVEIVNDNNVFILNSIKIGIDRADASRINDIKTKIGSSTGIIPQVVIEQ